MSKKKKRHSLKNNRSKKSTFSDSNSLISTYSVDDNAHDVNDNFSIPSFYVDSNFDDDIDSERN